MNARDYPARGRGRALAAFPRFAKHAVLSSGLLCLLFVSTGVSPTLADDSYPSQTSMEWVFPAKDSPYGRILGQAKVKFWIQYFHITNIGINWCEAKDELPAGWDTQDDRRLRTSSMCRSEPAYPSLGRDVMGRGTGWRHYTIPTGLVGGRYIVSVNAWSHRLPGHHHDGSHTTLSLHTLEVSK